MGLLRQLFFPKPSPPRRQILRPFGDHYNLQEIYDRLNAKYFESKLELSISWFGKGTIPRTRILFGSYHHPKKLIRINRFLDHRDFPEYVLEFIIYHEMVHHVRPPKRGKRGRRSIHHVEFKQKEKQYDQYLEAKSFIKNWVKKRVEYV